MEKQQNRMDALAALCKQKLLADPDHPRSGRLERDLALYRTAQRTGARIRGEQRAEPEKRGDGGEEEK